MDRKEVRTVVRVTVATLAKIAGRTRTQADDLMASVLRANEERIVDAVLKLTPGGDAPTPEQIAAALEGVGIRA